MTATITFAIAVLGAVLGLVNTWNTINNQRVRVRVRPMWAILPGGRMMGIEVTNLSTFPITISEVGLLYGRPRSKSPRRLAITAPIFFDQGPWPRKLGTREQVTAYFEVRDIPTGGRLWGAYARTVCDEMAYGKSAALKQMGEMLQGRD